MDLIKTLLETNNPNQIVEGPGLLYSKPDMIGINTNKDGPYDVVRKLLPSLARLTYAHLYVTDAHRHPTSDDLVDELEKTIDALCGELKELSRHDLKLALERSKPSQDEV